MSLRAERFAGPLDTKKKRRDRNKYFEGKIKRGHRSRKKTNHRIPHRTFLTENPFTDDYLYLDENSGQNLYEEFLTHSLECKKKFEERISKVDELFPPREDYEWCFYDPRYDFVYSGLFCDYYVPFGLPVIEPPIVFFC